MTTDQPQAAKRLTGPTLAPEQVWDKVFALIESLRSPADLNQAQIERVIGLPLLPQPGETSTQIVGGETTGGWRYFFDLSTYSDTDVRLGLHTYNSDRDDLGNSPTCTFPIKAFRKEMTRRGFEEKNLTSEGDRSFLWQFSKLPLTVDVAYYFEGKDYDFDHTCVDFALMSFVIPEY